MRQVAEQGIAWESVTAAVSGWEPPSCRLALGLAVTRGGDVRKAPYELSIPAEVGFDAMASEHAFKLWKAEFHLPENGQKHIDLRIIVAILRSVREPDSPGPIYDGISTKLPGAVDGHTRRSAPGRLQLSTCVRIA